MPPIVEHCKKATIPPCAQQKCIGPATGPSQARGQRRDDCIAAVDEDRQFNAGGQRQLGFSGAPMATTLYLQITDQAKITSFQGMFQAAAIAQPTPIVAFGFAV